MKTLKRMVVFLSLVLVILSASAGILSAAETDKTKQTTAAEAVEAVEDSSASKAWAAAIVVGIVATAGAVAMGIAISKSSESIARQPEAAGDVKSSMMLGLVFIETLVIYALIVAILIIFVL